MDSLSKYKYEDFYMCPICGSFVDKRNMELVLEHQHRNRSSSQLPASKRSGDQPGIRPEGKYHGTRAS